MSNLERFFRDPIVLLPLEVLQCHRFLLLFAAVPYVTLLRLFIWIHVPDSILGGIQSQLPERSELFSLSEHLHESLVVGLEMLDLKQRSTLGLTGHNYFI